MEENIIQATDGVTFLIGPHSMIFSASNEEWIFKTIWKLKPNEAEDLKESRQFGPGPWDWIGLQRESENTVIDREGVEYIINERDIDEYSGWRVIHLVGIRDISESVLRPIGQINKPDGLFGLVVRRPLGLLPVQKSQHGNFTPQNRGTGTAGKRSAIPDLVS